MRLGLVGLVCLGLSCGLNLRLSPEYDEPPADPCAVLSCPDATHCEEGDCVANDPCWNVACDEGDVCLDGQCVADRLDQDGDGYAAGTDCDDGDPDVFPGVTRPCQTECGEGVATCIGPDWSECPAPRNCECEPGDSRKERCGQCGEAERLCTNEGHWAPQPGPCQHRGECEAGATESRACGPCGGTEERTCDDECAWGEWGDCAIGAVECQLGDAESEPCGPCDQGTRTRDCDGNCNYGPWSACELQDQDVCRPGSEVVESCGDCGFLTSTCNDECQWEDGLCVWEDCTPGEIELKDCPCGGAQSTRTCIEDGCWTAWTPCLTAAIECLVENEIAPCANDCGVGTCVDGCWDGCSPCVCHDDGEDHCVGEAWITQGGCPNGDDEQNSCQDQAGTCRVVGVCPDG